MQPADNRHIAYSPCLTTPPALVELAGAGRVAVRAGASRLPPVVLVLPSHRGKSFSRPTMPVIFGFFGTWDLMIIAFIAMLLFGNRLPSMMRSLGQGVQEFKKGVAGLEEEHHEDDQTKLDEKR